MAVVGSRVREGLQLVLQRGPWTLSPGMLLFSQGLETGSTGLQNGIKRGVQHVYINIRFTSGSFIH